MMIDEVFESILNEKITNIHTCLLAEIVKFDAKKMKADVKPLCGKKYKDGLIEDLPIIQNIPVSMVKAGCFYFRVPYKSGDKVVIAFSERRIDEVINDNDFECKGARKHNLKDAIVIGGINPFTNALDGEHVDDLLIINSDTDSKVVIKENGDMIIKGKQILVDGDGVEVKANKVFVDSNNIILSSNSEGVPLGDTLKEYLDNHTHPYSWTDPAGSGTTQPPSPSPAPSSKVKLG